MTEPITLVIADDQPLFLEGVRGAITTRYPEFKIVGTATNGREAVDRVEEHRPDMAILDIRMPEMDGIEAAARIKAIHSDVKIVLLTTFNEAELLKKGLTAGISGYILKESPIDEIIDSIRSISRGNLHISAQAAANVKDILTRTDSGSQIFSKSIGDSHDEHDPLFGLAPREREILNLVLRGKGNRQIAEEINLSEGTVRNYIHNIYEHLGVHTRGELFVWASENL